MLYFPIRCLCRGHNSPPPDKYWSHREDGDVVKQPPIDRTRHEISEAETIAPQANEVADEPRSIEELPNPRMQGFIEEFKTGANTSSCK